MQVRKPAYSSASKMLKVQLLYSTSKGSVSYVAHRLRLQLDANLHSISNNEAKSSTALTGLECTLQARRHENESRAT